MDFSRLKTIFTEVLARQSGPERTAYLDEASRGDAELRAQAEELLRDHERIGRFLGTAAGSTSLPAEVAPGDPQHGGLSQAQASSTCAPPLGPGTEVSGMVIGPYKLLQPIGEGGDGHSLHGRANESRSPNCRPETDQERHGQPPRACTIQR